MDSTTYQRYGGMVFIPTQDYHDLIIENYKLKESIKVLEKSISELRLQWEERIR